MKKDLSLTNREEQVMKVFWNSDSPLTTPELMEHLTGSFEYAAQLHRVINSLLDKKLISVCGLVISGKKNARKFKATINEEDYTTNLLLQNVSKKKMLAKVALALVNESISNPEISGSDQEEAELIQELEDLIRKYQDEHES